MYVQLQRTSIAIVLERFEISKYLIGCHDNMTYVSNLIFARGKVDSLHKDS
jgi:hypothetical protein